MKPIPLNQARIALVYDRVNKFGGAERILLSLHHLFPKAPLYTSVHSPSSAPWAKDFKVIPSFLNSIPPFRTRHERLAPLMPWAFESFDLSGFDLILSITSAEAKGVLTSPRQLHVCYCLTPTRYLWSHTHTYLHSPLRRLIMTPFISTLRRWDFLAARRPDYLIPISVTVSNRIKKYYRLPPESVIYPPVNTAFFAQHPSKCHTKQRDYFLLVSRATEYKGIDYVINTFTQTPRPLIIVASGQGVSRLKALNLPHIQVLSNITDTHLSCLYHHAKALIFPQEEDFGIVALEAQSAGLPVIAYNRGGAIETVIDQKTGILYNDPTPASLETALKRFDTLTLQPNAICQHARQFDTKVFTNSLINQLEHLWQKHQVR
jgi:glycosyltransferase involved in cell wall biosynthesis